MTPTLRKIHRYTWLFLALAMPFAWLASVWVIPEQVLQSPIYNHQPDPLPLLVQSKQSGDFILHLRQDSTGSRKQIEIFIQKPLENPNTTLTIITEDQTSGKKETQLGVLGSRGIWRFDLDSLTARNSHFSLRFDDKIQGRTLLSVPFHKE